MNRLILVIAAIVCGSDHIFSQQGAKIIFKDVGQGNCTLVLPFEKEVPMLLVDCGSSMIHHRRLKGIKVYNADGCSKDLYEKILKHRLSNSHVSTKIIIVLSHPDKDHYNWVEKFVAKFDDTKESLEVCMIYLGGNQSEYTCNKKFRERLKKLTAEKKVVLINETSSFDDCRYLDLDTTVNDYASKRGHYLLLPAYNGGYQKKNKTPVKVKKTAENDDKDEEKETKEDDKNSSSLIIQVDFAGKKCLLMGDATKDTTAFVMETLDGVRSGQLNKERLNSVLKGTPNILKSDIILASHHGAADTECSCEGWLNAVNPQWVVLSSGVPVIYRHPREKTIETYLKLNSLEKVPLHSVYFAREGTSSTIGSDVCHAEFNVTADNFNQCYYGAMLTTHAVYCTLAQGDITCTLVPGIKPEMVFSRSYSVYNHGDLAMAIMERSSSDSEEGINLRGEKKGDILIEFEEPLFSIAYMSSLDLSGLKIGVDKSERFLRLINSLIKHGKVMKKIVLDGNNLNDVDFVTSLCSLIKKWPSIVELSLKNNNLDDMQMDLIRDAWDNRGLQLK